MKRELLINQSRVGRWLTVVLALLLMPLGVWAEDSSVTYTFTGMTGSSVSGYTYDVPSTAGGESKIWRVKNFSATDESHNNRTTENYVLSESSLGISNIFATSSSGTVIDFMLESDFTLSGSFVSAEITYSTSSMSQCKAVVYKLDNVYCTLTDADATLGTSPVTLSLRSVYEDQKNFDENKIALGFTFTTNKYDGTSGAFSIQSITINTTPLTYYNLWVGGRQVNTGNAWNVMGDGGTPTVVFDESTSTLTLNNATINGNVVSQLADDLTVHLVGENVIHNGEHAFLMSGNGDLKFTAASGAKLLTDATTDAMFAYSTSSSSAISLGINDLPNGYKLSYDAELKRCIGESYDILIYAFTNGSSNLGPQCVTSANCDRLAGAYDETTSTWDNETITLSYDYSTTTLTLNNMNLETASPNGTVYFINCDGTKAKNITINLLGENKLRQFNGEEGARFIYNGHEDGQITITTNPQNPGSLTMPDMSATLEETDVLEMYYTNHVNYKNGLGYSKDENNVRYIQTLPSIGLTVAGVPVNASNASNVLDEVDEETELPTVSFDAEHNILTLNGADIYVESGDAIVSGLENLTVFLVGENYITCYGKMFNKTSAVGAATITFTTEEGSNGSLSFMCGEEDIFGDGVAPVYTYVFLKDDGDSHYITSSLGLSVGGVDVTLFNTGNVLGDGKVSYNSTTHTLTLNNATIESAEENPGIVYENEDDLTIALIGNNSVRGSYNCAAIQKNYGVETPNLTFAKGAPDQHFSLTLTAESANDLIYGFDADFGSFFVFNDEDDGIYTKTICSSILGGTGSTDEPFLIKTAQDLKDFATYINSGKISNQSNAKLNNSIIWEDLEGFEPIGNNTKSFQGTFDGAGFTISNLSFIADEEDNAVYAGLFGKIDNSATIKDLTLSNCNFSGGENAGAIVAYLQSGTIQDCNVTGCSVETRNAQSPNAGGVAGYIYDGTIQRCNVTGSTVNGTTTYTDGGGVASTGGIAGIIYGGTISACEVENTAITSSHALPIDYQPAGGIVGNCYFDVESATTVSGNAVKGTTTVSSIDNNPDSEGGHTLVGAIVGFYRSASLSNNTYEYTVTVSTRKQADNAATTTAGYTHRGLGGSVEFDNDNYPEFTAGLTDLADNDGAVMYTQTVTVPGETPQASVTAEQNTYYSTAMISDALAYLVAPGQTVTLNANPGDGYIINTFTATNATTSDAITTTPTELGEGEMQYTFAMPDAPVTVALTTVAAYGIAVAGIEVTELNYTNVLGDGKVSYNATTNTLTLNNANIVSGDEAVGIYYSGSDNLTISLIGSNSINSGSCSPIRGSETPQLIFAKDDNQPCSLRTENTDGWAIDGFSETNFGGLFKLESQETEDDETTYYMTLTSTILSGGSGTSADPFIIATANDLKNFASYIRESVIPNTSFAKLSDDIGENGLDCSTLEFEPIGYGSTYFLGTFDGNNKTIKNLTVNDNAGDCVGFVRILGEGGVIKDLTLDNLTLSGGNSSSNDIGGLVGILNGGTINNCTIKNSTVSCRKGLQDSPANSQNPTVGGFVGESNGTIVNCTLLNTAVKAETFDTWASGANANAGGIVGNVSGGTISGCQVKGTSTVLASYGEYSASIAAGALFAKYSAAQLSNNIYEYTVTVTEKVYVDNPELQTQELQTTNKSGYTQRAIGGQRWNGQTEENEAIPDVAANNGAVMYTQTVTLPEESEQATVIGEDNTYYDTTVISDALAYLVAPGQTVTLNANPGNGYAIASLTATNTTTSAAITTTPTPLEDGIKQYTFTMPDAPVTIALETVQTIGIRIAGVEVTELNETDVLGDGKVSFTPAVPATETTPAVPATLTLNGAAINGGVYVYGESLGQLVVHLNGQNIIDGGYVSNDENGDWAFATSVQNAKLTIATDEANPGQLLLRSSYVNEWENAEYYSGWYPTFTNGLVESQNYTDKKVLIAQGPVMTPGEGIYWPDQQYTISGREGVAIKYRDNLGHFDETTYAGAFTMSTVGHYSVNVRQEVTVDETAFTLSADNVYIVHSKPAFSLASGSYAGAQNITLSNLPANLPTGEEYYPQVWYYKGDNTNDSVRITSVEQAIMVSESTKVCVYILDEDSGKVLKSKPVEAEYVILPDIANAVVVSLEDSVYTGKSIVPEFIVKASADAEGNLTEGTDYTVSYKQDETIVESMINVGTYTIVITGIGAYGGTKEATFSITQATPTITFAQERYSAVLGEEFTSPATVDEWEVTPTASSNTNVANISEGQIVLVGVGTTTITVTYAGSDNYNSTTASYELVVARALDVAFVGSNLWASYYATENLATPEGLTAYVVSAVEGSVVTVQSVGYIPANNGVLLKREEGGDADGYVAAPYTGNTSTVTNLLGGTTSATAVSSLGDPVYVLYNDQFKRATSGTIPAGRAYLALNGQMASAGAPQLLTLNIASNENTAIGTIMADADSNDSWYTIDGLKVIGKPQRKGLYIKNGKKVYFNKK